MFRLIVFVALPALVLTGCGPASTVLAEDIGYDSLKTNANTPSLARGQQSAFQTNNYYGAPYGYGSSYGTGRGYYNRR